MKINNEIRDRIIESIKISSKILVNNVKEYLEKIKKVNSVEELMECKKAILINWLNIIPLSVDHCYFCQLYWPECKNCEYGKIHGICKNNLDSDYINISNTLEELKNKINIKYCDHDDYTHKRVTVKCKCDMKYRRKINDENNYGHCNKCGEILS